MKKLIVAIALSLSCSAHAAVVSVDWKTAGDGLITRDTVTGLEWLDLTETNGMTFDDVSTLLVGGGELSGWRYASTGETIALWLNFSIDLNAYHDVDVPGVDANIAFASGYLGNIVHEFETDRELNGTLGITGDVPADERHTHLGAYTDIDTSFYNDERHSWSDDLSHLHTGSYLVRVDAVPVPAAVWLFGSGLLGLVAVARRRG